MTNHFAQHTMPKQVLSIFLLMLSGLVYAQPTPQSIELAKIVPIADVHMHTYQQNPRSATWWREMMDANGVKWGGAVGDYREDVQTELGNRYIPAVGQPEFFKVFFKEGRSGLIDPNNETFKDLYTRSEKLFSEGKIKGFGEFHTDNHSSGPPRIRRSIRTDNPAMRKFYEIANRYGGFVQIHAEFDGDFEKDILNLSADYPNTTTVLSHCLSTKNVDNVAAILEKRKNIVCEVSSLGAVHVNRLNIPRSPHAYDSGGLYGNWIKFIEAYPDQVLIGSDPCCGIDASYSEIISELRTSVLPYLSPVTMEKVANKNAVRIFSLKNEALK
jgi:predicted TIM-barrel fold metal-dependent hydrolase